MVITLSETLDAREHCGVLIHFAKSSERWDYSQRSDLISSGGSGSVENMIPSEGSGSDNILEESGV